MYGPRMWGWRGISASKVAIERWTLTAPPMQFLIQVVLLNTSEKTIQMRIFLSANLGRHPQPETGPGRIPKNDPDWSFGARYVARTQGFEILSGVRRGTNNLKVIRQRDVLLTDQIHPNGVCLLVYLIAPGSTPRSDKRMALTNHETPIVGVSLGSPSTESERKFKVFAHSKGIRSD